MEVSLLCIQWQEKAWTFPPTALLPPPVPSLSINVPPIQPLSPYFPFGAWSSKNTVFKFRSALDLWLEQKSVRSVSDADGEATELAQWNSSNFSCDAQMWKLILPTETKWRGESSMSGVVEQIPPRWTLLLLFIALTSISNWWKLTEAQVYQLPPAQAWTRTRDSGSSESPVHLGLVWITNWTGKLFSLRAASQLEVGGLAATGD